METSSSLNNSGLARKIKQFVHNEIVNEPGAVSVSGEWHLHRIQKKSSNTCAHEAINNCFRCMQNNSREAFGTLGRSKSDGERG